MKTLCLIPAKGTSARLPGKNLREVGGQTLVAWAAAVGLAARALGLVELVVISTDDAMIEKAGLKHGTAVHWRNAVLRADEGATVRDVAMDLLQTREDNDMGLCSWACRAHHGCPWDLVLILVPTTPLRTLRTVVGAYKLMAEAGFAHPVLTAVPARKPPAQMLAQPIDGLWRAPFPEAGGEWVTHEGGAIWTRPEWLREDKSFYDRPCLVYEVPPEEAVDVDTELDLIVAEALLARQASG